MDLYHQMSFKISERVTKNYSTSFYSATRLFDKKTRAAIFAIYGFVRIADEIVDTFHAYDKKILLDKFEKEYYDSLNEGISVNPVLHSFQLTVKEYGISKDYVEAFLDSMRSDLDKKEYTTTEEIDRYIYGSADVVGLMCLQVFSGGNKKLFYELEKPAMKLGSAFQKVNFLRDLRNDMENLGRRYFPNVDKDNFNEDLKILIIKDIQSDFDYALEGIKKLPGNSKLAVLSAYLYYLALLKKIKGTSAKNIISERIRISNAKKLILLLKAFTLQKLKLI